MISYAQNHEDVVLARGFPAPSGFYIDVGAGSPEIHSVTKHFYDRGWHGVNVEPLPRWHRELEKARPRDINLAFGLAAAPGELEFFDVSADAAEESTFSAEVADRLRERGFQLKVTTVAVTTLAAVCDEHAEGAIDFLKIDVEGLELEVLRGGDWTRFRPAVVVVESTEPGSGKLAETGVLEFMTDMRYLPVLFDGLNTFYVADEQDRELRHRLAAPANPNDGFEDGELARTRRRAEGFERRVIELTEELNGARHDLEQTRGRLAAAERLAADLRQEIAASQGRNDVLEQRLAIAQEEVARSRREAGDARIQFTAAREALELALAAPERG